ncbi:MULTISPECIES: hypothetical protein [Fischerella]|nr:MULTISPECIES: hypothetical protein [Fischerella]
MDSLGFWQKVYSDRLDRTGEGVFGLTEDLENYPEFLERVGNSSEL